MVFFFFRQKTAYEVEYGLVGSEMCIRDRDVFGRPLDEDDPGAAHQPADDRQIQVGPAKRIELSLIHI